MQRLRICHWLSTDLSHETKLPSKSKWAGALSIATPSHCDTLEISMTVVTVGPKAFTRTATRL
jgi:hypothetical protein